MGAAIVWIKDHHPWLGLLAWLGPGVVSFWWLIYRDALGRSVFRGYSDTALVFMVGMLVWPLALPAVAAVVCIHGVLIRLPTQAARWMQRRHAQSAVVHQPDLGPHRTPSCAACGRPFGETP